MTIKKDEPMAANICKRGIKTMTALAMIMTVSLGTLSGCGAKEEVEEVTKVDVDVSSPSVKELHQNGNFIGTIESDGKVAITPRISGLVTTRNFKVGDYVNAGDVLFTMDAKEYELNRMSAEASVRSADASLGAQKLRNQETEASASESLNTIETKSVELSNAVTNAEREEANAKSKRDVYGNDKRIYESEGESIRKKRDTAYDKAASESSFAAHLNSVKDVYQSIASSSDPVEAAKSNGVSEEAIGTETDAGKIANIYLKNNSQYDSLEQLTTAIDTATEAARSADSERKDLDSAFSSNTVSRIEAALNEKVEEGNIKSAQEAKVLAQKMKDDYENFTKKTQLADVQAKLAEGYAAVQSADAAGVTARTDLAAANLKIEYSTVKAPISGVIQAINVNQYEMASDQSVAYVISNPNQKKVVFYVAEDVKNNMTLGQSIVLKKNDTEYSGAVDYIGNTVDEEKKLYKISAFLNESAKEQFSVGANVSLNTSIKTEKSALTIPIGAVYYSEGKPYVYIAKDGKAIKTDIETGISDSEVIQVSSGLSASDQVIVSWSSQLKDQADINIKNQSLDKAAKKKEATEKTENKADQEAYIKSDYVRTCN